MRLRKDGGESKSALLYRCETVLPVVAANKLLGILHS